MRTLGKQGKKWLKTRKRWFKTFPSDHYICYICGHHLLNWQVTLDHVESRSRHPELRYTLSNLKPCCYSCNRAKGSLSLEQYREKLNRRLKEN